MTDQPENAAETSAAKCVTNDAATIATSLQAFRRIGDDLLRLIDGLYGHLQGILDSIRQRRRRLLIRHLEQSDRIAGRRLEHQLP